MLLFSDEEMKPEVFAIKFANPENATKFKAAFDEAVIKTTEVEAKLILLGEGREDDGEIAIASDKGDEEKQEKQDHDDTANQEIAQKLEKLDIETKN